MLSPFCEKRRQFYFSCAPPGFASALLDVVQFFFDCSPSALHPLLQVKCEVNLRETSQEASDWSCSARYMRIRIFLQDLNNIAWIEEIYASVDEEKHTKMCKQHNWLKHSTQKPSISLYQASMILASMVRTVHLRALVHLCVLRPNTARGCSARWF